jgi:hypothetical protein
MTRTIFRETWVARKTRITVSNHPDVREISKLASTLVDMVAPSRNQITVVAKIRAIWKTTISALAMREEPADRDAAARIAN